MEHYITEINIEKLRHLSNIVISLNPEQRQHLIITGKNGSGKTSLLIALQKYLLAINEDIFNYLLEDCIPGLRKAEEELNKAKTEKEKNEIKTDPVYEYYTKTIKQYAEGVRVSFNDSEHLEDLYFQGDFITAYFSANRKTHMVRTKGVEDIKLNDAYAVNSQPGELLHKYMVHLKTQQSYARNEGDMATAERIQGWFNRFTGALQILLDNDSLELEYDYKEYDFKIHESGRDPFGLDELSDGYSSVIQIVSDLILRMDKNWLLGDGISQYDIEGIVLIDEIETHLHIALQKKIMPFLTEFFPRIQFIVTTHSPYILNSLSNAKVYDLENCVELEDLSAYSADDLAEGYFGADEYSNIVKEKINKYQYLKEKQDLTEEERAERARLRCELRYTHKGLSPEIAGILDEIEGNDL
ncbi:MAG: AAA family ATPase [Butyrivibrio sp.]|nr:AAA family ATPase [Acetatifactor muris]MCM1559907.1 AAA family ATPase [Butyrivibrio sp.]